MTNEEIKQKLDCTARITGNELVKSALNIITVQEEEIDGLKNENARLKEKLKQVLLSIDTVKEMNTMCAVEEQREDAVKEFAEKLKERTVMSYDHFTGIQKVVLAEQIDELLEELKKCRR